MFERLLDILQLLIVAINNNTAALSGGVEVEATPPDFGSEPTPPAGKAPAPPAKRGKAGGKAPAAPSKTPAPPAKKQLSKEEMNTKLIEHWKRLGNDRGPIDELFSQFGYPGLDQLPAEQYEAFLAEMEQLQP